MVNLSEIFVLDGLAVARRTADAVGECLPSMFLIRDGTPNWARPVALDHPSDYARVAEENGAGAVVVVWSHVVIDADDPTTKLVRLFAGMINAKGEVVKAAKQQRWADQREWTVPSVFTGPLPLEPQSWVM